jgi:methionyl-tRNA synthetase
MAGVFACNQYIDTQAPWALRKTNPERMHAVLGTLVRAIHDLAICIWPVIPESAERLLAQIDSKPADSLGPDWYDAKAASGFRLSPPTGIFPRLELKDAAA